MRLALLLALAGVLQLAEGVVRQALLIAQRLAQVAHRRVALAGVARCIRVDHDLHVLHQLPHLFHQFGRLGHAALFHQLLQLVHHLLQLIAGHPHAFAVLVRLVGVVGNALGLLGQFVHVFLHRLTHFLHQFVDLGGVGPVADRLVQPVLGALQPFQRRLQVALFDQEGQRPEFLGNRVAVFGRQAGLFGVQLAQQHLQARQHALLADQPFGLVQHRLQPLRRRRRVGAVPQKITAQFGQCRRHRIEKAFAGQGDLHGLGLAGLVDRVGGRQAHQHGKVGEGVFGHVIHQRLFKGGAVAPDRHRQVQNQRRLRLGVDGQAIAALDGGQIKGNFGMPSGHAIVIGGGKGQAHPPVLLARDLALGHDGRALVRRRHDGPGAPALAVDHDGAGFRQGEFLRRVRSRGHIGAGAARHGFREGQRADLSVKADLHAAADGHFDGVGGDVVQVQRGLAGIGRRLQPTLPGGTGGQRLGLPRRKAGHRGGAPERAEQQARHQYGQRDEAQPERVLPRQPQVGDDGLCRRRPCGHPRPVHLPHSL